MEYYGNNDWRDYQSLTHWGIKGMRWGVRRFQKKDGSFTSAGKKRYKDGAILGRKTSTFDDVEAKKAGVERDRKEAADRIKFYGGKNVAVEKIKAEAGYASRVEVGRGAAKAALSGLGSVGLASATAAAGGTTGLTAAIIMSGGVGAVAAAALAAKAVNVIRRHAKDQIAYTRDSEYGADTVVTTKKD